MKKNTLIHFTIKNVNNINFTHINSDNKNVDWYNLDSRRDYMDYNSKKNDRMQELYELKKSYSKEKPKSYTKLRDALVISNDRLNTWVLTFGVIICSLLIGFITR